MAYNTLITELRGVFIKMDYLSARRYLTKEQASTMGKVSAKVRELKRLAEADSDPYPIRSGLQLAIITIDLRLPAPNEHCALLFEASGYENRYRWMLDMEKQHGIIGWHDAGRRLLKMTRPLK